MTKTANDTVGWAPAKWMSPSVRRTMAQKVYACMFSVALALLITSSAAGQGVESSRSVRFGIVLDGPWIGNDSVRSAFESEIRTLLEPEFNVAFPLNYQLTADWTLEGVTAAVDTLFTAPGVDFVLAMGPISSHVVARRQDLSKPAVAAFVLDAQMQGLPIEDGGSGVANLSYVSLPAAIERDLAMFRSLVRFDRVVLLANPYFLEAAPGLEDRMGQAAGDLGVELTIVPALPPVSSVMELLPDGTEAVYLAPLLHFQPAEWLQLINQLNAENIATFSSLGRSEVDRGVFATLGTDNFFPRVSRRVALNIQRILLGEDAAVLPVAFAVGERLTINMETARQIGVYPSWNYLVEADLLNEEPSADGRTLDLAAVAREAAEVNLQLQAEERRVRAGAEEVRRARASLLPQLDASVVSTFIDEDRAAASLGSQAQRSLSGGVSATQIIFSEPAWANLSVQKNVHETRVQDRNRVRLDVIQEAASSYLNLLRAKTIRSVRRDNLQLTRSNLELARVRNNIGTSGPGEVFRWEAEMANRRIDVLDARADEFLAATALNRSLNRPLEETLRTEEPSMFDAELLTADPRLMQYVDNPRIYLVFRDFWVQEGLDASPELRQLDAAIAAQSRLFRSATSSFWAPTIALQASLSRMLSEGGAGAGEFNLELPPGSPDLRGALPQANNTSWSVGIQASLPLFLGGARVAERARASEELDRLRVEREGVASRIEQRIRSALHSLGASYPSIQLRMDATEAARQNLALVTDAYGQGVVSILELLDAQNAALVAEEAAANAVYESLLDLMELQRAVGRFDFFRSPEERDAILQRMADFFAQAERQR